MPGKKFTDDGIRPTHTAVVRLKSYGKGDDVHLCKNRRPHLLILTPDAVQLFTTNDADSGSDMTSLASARFSSSLVALRERHSTRMLGRLVRIPERPEGSVTGAYDAPGETDPEDLAEGQVFRVGVALNQLLGIQPYKENQLIIWYQPNKPSKKRIVEDQTMMVLRGLLGAVEAMAKWDTSAPRPSAPSSGAHHFTIKLTDAAEVLLIKDAVESAQRKLTLATLWLSEGLPLEPESNLVVVTVGNRNPDGGPAYTIPLPEWNTEMALPLETSQALASIASRRAVNTVVSVYMSTPLGVAVAEIPLLRVAQSASEGGAPFGAIATLQSEPQEDTKRLGKRWVVTLSWCARRGELVETLAGRVGNEVGNEAVVDPTPGSRSRSASPTKKALAGSSSSSSMAASREAVAMRPAVAAKSARSSEDGSMGLIVGLLALTGFSAVARHLRCQLDRLRGPSVPALDSTPNALCYRWHLTLLDVDIAEETVNQAPTSPPVKRSLSISVASEHHPLTGSLGSPIPQHIALLIEHYPGILTPDVARRFIVGLDSETKAFSAMSSMAKWTSENNLKDILHKPQPAFEAMKRHYVHGFPGWSRKKDCLVEIECMGSWPAAYTSIVAEKFSEQAMLEHLLFTYQYAFGVLDPRPLPNGKTVKIVDLGGLCMSDLKTPGFKLITRVGAMLSLNFPQRLHQCFLVNAPGWWAVAWRLIAPLIPPKIRKQMTLFSKNDKETAAKAMLEWIDEDVLPVQYGGKNELPLSQCQFEMDMADYVARLNVPEP